MTAYIGVVSHPYFAVSNQAGAFTIANVPPGTYSIKAWHEQYGWTTQSVRVAAGQASSVEFKFTSDTKPAAAKPRADGRDVDDFRSPVEIGRHVRDAGDGRLNPVRGGGVGLEDEVRHVVHIERLGQHLVPTSSTASATFPASRTPSITMTAAPGAVLRIAASSERSWESGR